MTDQSEKYRRQNLEAKRIIVSRSDKYVPGSLQLAWARENLKREQEHADEENRKRWEKAKEQPPAAEPLFDEGSGAA